MQNPLFLIVDLFCGAGGTTTGFTMAKDGIAKVIACVNHDAKAIESHWKNHPEVVHFEEDIRTLDLTELKNIVCQARNEYPDANLILWASLECTNFSKAKGGQARNADSRTLAEHLYRYIHAIDPDYVQIENVVEFMSWGPLDEKGKPVSRKNGQDWMKWRNEICRFGYRDEWQELNSANFGAYTSRNRLFGCFAKDSLPIAWPTPTHSKKASAGMFNHLKKWMPVKDVLDFKDEGESIFTRKKPLSDKTLERIFAGLLKYVARGDKAFISKYYSGRPAGKNITTDGPAGTITTVDSQALVNVTLHPKKVQVNCNCGNSWISSEDKYLNEPCIECGSFEGHVSFIDDSFIVQRNNGEPKSKLVDIDGPARTLTSTGGNQDLVQPEFLTHYYGSGGQLSSVENPAPVIPTKARTALIQAKHFIDKHFGINAQNQSIDQPAGSIMPTDKHRLVECEPFIMPTNFNNQPTSIEQPAGTITANRKHSYIINPSHGGHASSTHAPCPVIIARQDKAPLYFVQVEQGQVSMAVYEGDSEICIRIKEFMVIYGLVDIKMRMLRVPELLKIQGFPDDYVLCGTQSDHKKFIGNSVVPHVVRAWVEAMAEKYIDKLKKVA